MLALTLTIFGTLACTAKKNKNYFEKKAKSFIKRQLSSDGLELGKIANIRDVKMATPLDYRGMLANFIF